MGEGRTFQLGDQRIAVFHTRGGRFFAVQAECPHRGGPLADGLLGGTTLVCPLHSWRFELDGGQALEGECGLTTYPVECTADGEVVVQLG